MYGLKNALVTPNLTDAAILSTTAGNFWPCILMAAIVRALVTDERNFQLNALIRTHLFVYVIQLPIKLHSDASRYRRETSRFARNTAKVKAVLSAKRLARFGRWKISLGAQQRWAAVNRCNYLLVVDINDITRGWSARRSSVTSVRSDHSQPALSTLTTGQIFGQRIP